MTVGWTISRRFLSIRITLATCPLATLSENGLSPTPYSLPNWGASKGPISIKKTRPFAIFYG